MFDSDIEIKRNRWLKYFQSLTTKISPIFLEKVASESIKQRFIIVNWLSKKINAKTISLKNEIGRNYNYRR